MKTILRPLVFTGLLLLFAAGASAQSILSSVDGKRVDLDAQDGKIVVLAVGAAWLPLSEKQAGFTNALVKKYQGRPVVFYFVVTDSTNTRSKNFASDDDVKDFAVRNKISVPVLRDSDGVMMKRKYKLEQVPSFVILDRAGNASTETFGGLDPKFDLTGPISQAIDRLLSQ